MSLEQLIQQLSHTSYQAKTDEDLYAEAERRFESEYGQKRLSAQQAWETQDAALARELEGLSDSYGRERAQSAAQTDASYRQAQRQALSRGMQRSSYNNATLGNISLAGEEARRDISRRQTEAENEVQEKRTLLSTQLSQQLKQYDDGQRSDILSYADELSAREYDRQTADRNTQNELAMKLYEYQHQLEVEAIEQARWQAEFDAKYGQKTRSSGGGRKTESASAPRGKGVNNRTAMLN